MSYKNFFQLKQYLCVLYKIPQFFIFPFIRSGFRLFWFHIPVLFFYVFFYWIAGLGLGRVILFVTIIFLYFFFFFFLNYFFCILFPHHVVGCYCSYFTSFSFNMIWNVMKIICGYRLKKDVCFGLMPQLIV